MECARGVCTSYRPHRDNRSPVRSQLLPRQSAVGVQAIDVDNSGRRFPGAVRRLSELRERRRG
jgi:hypothetical protein